MTEPSSLLPWLAVVGASLPAVVLLVDWLRRSRGGVRGGVVWRSDDPGENRIALTLSGAIVPEHLRAQAAVLEKADARATYFVTADDAARHADALRALRAAGHEIGCLLRRGDDAAESAEAIRDAVDVTPRLVRDQGGWPAWRSRPRGDDFVPVGWVGAGAARSGTVAGLDAGVDGEALAAFLAQHGPAGPVAPCVAVSALVAHRPYRESPDRGWTGRMRGGRFGPATFRFLLRSGGLPAAHVLLVFVAAWFTLVHGQGRRASIQLRRRLHGRAGWLTELWWVYRHFFHYGRALVLRGDFLIRGAKPPPADYRGLEDVEPVMRAPGGVILISGHVGDWMRAGPRVNLHGRELSIVAVRGMGAGPSQVSRDAEQRPFHVIDAEQDPTAVGMAMVAALSEGHAVALLADRVVGGTSVRVPFLGAEASFPVGPWAVALATRAPVVVFFALPARGRRLMIELTGPFHVERGADESRDDALRRAVGEFAAVLEDTVRRHPFEWGNFFDFWSPE